ncbi:F-box/kelch-repeat protein [Trifolium medium]|uniref:F-box/kelch-repeat protein n=1 Tax=Trifolium medium TaxID=97028 RepID=A0A392MV29_9FABA|nr:F-box/kelch-repeat protein [Trifolium medium]
MSPSTTILPTDLIIEILSWLPVKLLVRFTCVSKLWKSLIFDPSFSRLHLQRSPKNTHVLLTLRESVNDVDSWVVTPYSVRHLFEHPASAVNEDECRRFKNNTYDAVGSTNGLVCLMDDNSQQDGVREIWFRFWNPTLRLRSKKSPTLIVMPNVDLSAQVHCGFGYDDSTDTFKVSQT